VKIYFFLFVINDSDLKEWSKSYLGEKFADKIEKIHGKKAGEEEGGRNFWSF
jgi:hypothetical protein